MSTDDQDVLTADEATDTPSGTEESEASRLNLDVTIATTGPCLRHVTVVVSEADLATVRNDAIREFAAEAQVPGFRVGRVPRELVQKRFKDEIDGQVKQQVLLRSLEQIAEDENLEPINEPDLAIEDLTIPESGDFRYEFDVEVRPEFDVPDFKEWSIEKPSGEISDEELDAYRQQYLTYYGTREIVEEPAAAGDVITCDFEFRHDGKSLSHQHGVDVTVRPILRFHDAELEGFDELICGAQAGDQRSTTVTVSSESPTIEMRGEDVAVDIKVTQVRRVNLPDMNKEFFDRIGVDTEDDFNDMMRESIGRQIEYQQRESMREQLTAKLTASADWDLPESLVMRQTENAMRREVLEMRQAGFTEDQIAARANQIRKEAVTITRNALKQHFVLDRVATDNNIECEASDIELEILRMSFQSGENPRKVRSRLVKSGMIENLEAQIRERKAIDFLMDQVQMKEVPRQPLAQSNVAAVSRSVCEQFASEGLPEPAADAED